MRLIHGDCLEVLPTLGDASIDAVITDPPYGDVTHAGARTTRPGMKVVDLIDFPPITGERFVALCSEFVRVAKRWVVMTCDWRHASLLEEAGLPLVRLGVWIKPDAAPQFTGDRPAAGWEAVAILHRKGRKRWGGGGHHAVWHQHVEREGLHPTQKPLRLVREWVRLFSEPGEIVLDPFMGSGTTGVASVMEGRGFVGVELNPEYFAVAEARIMEAEACRDGRGVGELFARRQPCD